MLVYLFLINALALALMLADKQKARKNRWRIPERTLMAVAILGGSLGMIVGMHLFHHKTKHLTFAMGLPVVLALQVVLCVVLLSR